MTQQDLPTLVYSGKSNSAVPIISESELQTITAEPWLEISKKGLQLEGLNFDRQGQLFLLDVFEGNIFKVNPETKEIKRPFVSHKANPAAIKIHKDGRLFICYLGDFKSTGGIFAATENGDNLQDIIEDLSTTYCIDSDDNLYVAMYGQGRVLVFNKRGYPIGQILIPGRDEGHMLRSTHPQFIPGTNQLIICSNDIEMDGGSMLYTVNGFAKGHKSYQFQ
ncbi:TPA: SMP-30/gluconolactonase/LRE family protein [Staphylococcus aureus]|nr:SMP-30/gluconolactonase/LRE family protein [Staphylococcus aureus]HDF0334661.1 SMP-30/gluconolactonase/LRE family protein [Staphylococcus aureus]